MLLSIARNKTKKHNKILMLAKNKLSSIETIYQALIDMEISHEEFIAILKENDNKYEEMKENLRSANEKKKNYEIE